MLPRTTPRSHCYHAAGARGTAGSRSRLEATSTRVYLAPRLGRTLSQRWSSKVGRRAGGGIGVGRIGGGGSRFRKVYIVIHDIGVGSSLRRRREMSGGGVNSK